MSETLIATNDLSVHFPIRGKKLFGPPPVVRAVYREGQFLWAGG